MQAIYFRIIFTNCVSAQIIRSSHILHMLPFPSFSYQANNVSLVVTDDAPTNSKALTRSYCVSDSPSTDCDAIG